VLANEGRKGPHMAESLSDQMKKAWTVLLNSAVSIGFDPSVLQVVQVIRQRDFSTVLLTAGVLTFSLVPVFIGRRRKVDNAKPTESSPEITKAKKGSLFEKVALVVASLSIAGMAIAVGVSVLITPTPNPRGVDGLAPYSTLAPPSSSSSAAPSTVESGQICDVNGAYPVEVVGVRSRDGRTGISGDLIVDVAVRIPPKVGHTYWLFSKATNGPGNFVYVAKDRIPEGVVTYPARVLLPKSGPGSVRDLFVADGDPNNLTWLQMNKAHDGDPSWDYPNRISLPSGVVEASNVCTIQKTRN
jgi:hypothetical protein